ncbi:MAG: VacJ family lipoprotein [Rhodospirillales bacterium]|nr:VacJ family lipoprotein [Alphaproteobacteria bacterium]USO04243.1 MAG: VacJ family lipoprotein [Rhodospirillales bacterium]
MKKLKNKECFRRGYYLLLVLFACLGLSACSTSGGGDVYVGDTLVSDPFEETNRRSLKVNEALDKAILEPAARGYRAATPKAFRLGLRNFLRNLKSPIIIGNQILQGDVEGTANSTLRMIVNTLAGFGGILDLATEGGVAYEPEDFGQTLATWGIGNGPYLVVPIFGPTTLRDGAGTLVDAYADPLRIYLFNTHREEWHYGRVGAGIIDQREELLDIIDDLRRNSFDYYAALRSAYIQRRQALINDEDPDKMGGPSIPDYD